MSRPPEGLPELAYAMNVHYAEWLEGEADLLHADIGDGCTVSDEQVEAAAEALWERWGSPRMFEHAPEHRKNSFRTDARTALRGAGFILEGDHA